MLNRASRAYPEVHDEASAQTKVIKKIFDLREVYLRESTVDQGTILGQVRSAFFMIFLDQTNTLKIIFS